MKFGFRIPSITKRIAARTSVKRIVQNELGLKAPRGYGWITNPKKFVYNKVYNKTTVGSGCMISLFVLIALPLGIFFYWLINFQNHICYFPML
jgi:hypothetical protein